jgi:hypothetical protein
MISSASPFTTAQFFGGMFSFLEAPETTLIDTKTAGTGQFSSPGTQGLSDLLSALSLAELQPCRKGIMKF